MADVTLVLNEGGGPVTLPATLGNVRRFIVPAGTRSLLITTASDVYVEWDATQTKLDDAAGTTSKQHLFGAGSFSIPCPGRGAKEELVSQTYAFLVGTAASQVVYVMAQGGDV